MAKITITLPDELYEKILRARGKINVSAICANSLRSVVEELEKAGELLPESKIDYPLYKDVLPINGYVSDYLSYRVRLRKAVRTECEVCKLPLTRITQLPEFGMLCVCCYETAIKSGKLTPKLKKW
ncbi:MAG: hypothetical protein QXG97_07645, partial [Nitrososphaerota archaeon]